MLSHLGDIVRAISPATADTAAAGGLTVVGTTIVLVTALWAIGGMAAAAWGWIDDVFGRRRQAFRRRPPRPSRS